MFECAYCSSQFGEKFNLIRYINVYMEGRNIKGPTLVPSIDLETIHLNFYKFQGKYAFTELFTVYLIFY